MVEKQPFKKRSLGCILKDVGEECVAFLYPSCCMMCENATEQQDHLCATCWRKIRFIETPFCQRLGVPFAVTDGENLVSPAALANPPIFDRARAAVVYEGAARLLVHRLKYQDQHNLAKGIAFMMSRAGIDLIHDADIICPIPLHWFRLWRRRFNQSMLLARQLAGLSGKTCDPFLLKRIKNTQPQFKLKKSRREENLKAAFKLHDGVETKLSGRRVLLIDDVMTTGATANAVARVLLKGGALAVDVLTFALTPPFLEVNAWDGLDPS